MEPYKATMSDREPSILRGQPKGVSAEPSHGANSKDAALAAQPRAEQPRAPSRSSRPSAPTFHAAGFWRRARAAFIDLSVILPVALVLAWLSGKVTGVHLPESRHHGIDFWLDLLLASDPALLGIIGLCLATATVYVLVFQVTWACTLGMRLSRIHIIDIYGDSPSIVRVIARTAGYLATVATLGLGFVWIGFDRERRGLHDWLSGTYVVKL